MDTSEPISPAFLRNRFGESYLHDVNRQIFSSEPSRTVFERRLSVDFDADDTLFIFIGSDSGLLHEYLRGQPLGKGARRLIIESDELHSLIEPRAARTGDEAMLCRFGEWEATLQACEVERYAHGGRIELVESLGCVHDHLGRYVSILRQVRADLKSAVHRHRVQVNGQYFVRKQLQNACENRVPASVLRGLGTGHTAMVLGGGPSLDDAIDWVVTHRESLFLIVASRLCRQLRDLDIRPDVVVAVDPQSGMYDLSKEGILWTDVVLVSSFHLAPQLLQQWRGPRLYLDKLHPWTESPSPGESGNFTGAGPTVSHCGVALASQCGFDQILMSGVDMCHAIGGGSHASGTIESMIGALPTQCDATVMTYNGRTAGTGRALQHGAEILERLGREINAERPRLFNTSAHAARIDSIPLLDLDDVVLSARRPEIVLPDDVPTPAEHLERVRREQTDAIRRFRAIGRRCNDAARLLDAMDEATNERGFDAKRRRLERLERNLGRDHGPWFDMIKNYASAELLATVKPSGFGDEDSERQDWGHNYYRVVKRTANLFIELLESCDRRTTMRLMEVEKTPDFDALLAYWAEENTPGRVLQLRARLGSQVSDDLVARLNESAKAFLATLERGETAHEVQVREKVLNPVNILRNLAFLYRERVDTDLAHLATSLDSLARPHDVFAAYAKGLCAELASEPEQALEDYRAVLDRFGEWLEDGGIPEGFDELLEDTLRHVAQCHLEVSDGEAALESLTLLAQLSPSYTSRQAHLQHLLGRHDDALMTLETHMQRCPGDWRALLQIADIYSTLDAGDAADMARRLAKEMRNEEETTDELDKAA